MKKAIIATVKVNDEISIKVRATLGSDKSCYIVTDCGHKKITKSLGDKNTKITKAVLTANYLVAPFHRRGVSCEVRGTYSVILFR